MDGHDRDPELACLAQLTAALHPLQSLTSCTVQPGELAFDSKTGRATLVFIVAKVKQRVPTFIVRSSEPQMTQGDFLK